MKISVIVPVFKTEKYLRDCLDSLVKQTLEDIEILVVNDGSPDQSQLIIDEYASKYSQIRALIKNNGGLSDARNYGIENARGEYIAFVDSDDYVEVNMLEEMYQFAKERSLDIVVCDTIMEYPNRSYILKADLGYTNDPIEAYLIAYPNAPARLINRNLMKKLKFQVGIWYEDLELMPRLVTMTNKIDFLHKAYYHYVQHEQSIMNQKEFHPKFNDIFLALDHIYCEFQQSGLLERYNLEIEYLFISHLQRSAVLRFSGLAGSKDSLREISNIMSHRFPNWHKNSYYRQSSWKFKLICQCARFHQYWLISQMKHFI